MTTPLLALQQVSLQLGRSPRYSLQDISFQLQAEETTVLLGNRGSGKTLLLQLINGLKSPSQGQIRWLGQDLSQYPPLALRRQIAWLPQQPRLLGMTGKAAIAYPLQLQGRSNREIQQRLELWLERFKIPLPWLELREAALSPSAAQAIALIRALVLEPKLLLLDNPWPQLTNEAAPSQPSQPAQSLEAGDPSAHPAWQNPQEQITSALATFTQTGGAIVWAMAPAQLPIARELQIAQQLITLAKGRLNHQKQVTAEQSWQQLINEPMLLAPTATETDEEDWDD